MDDLAVLERVERVRRVIGEQPGRVELGERVASGNETRALAARRAGRTIEATDYFFAPDASKAEIDEFLAFDTQVGEEDIALVESVQRGLDRRPFSRAGCCRRASG